MNLPAKRRCICGNSSRYPVCDFSHESENWNCASDRSDVASWSFVAGPHNFNVAEKLAAEFAGIAAHLADGRVISEKCVVITEGTDVHSIDVLRSRIESEQVFVVSIGLPAEWIASFFGNAKILQLDGENGMEIWAAIRSACLTEFQLAKPVAPVTIGSAFVSHSVEDEKVLFPAVDFLRRHYLADLFLCADSIASGTHWQTEIVSQLHQKDLFIAVLSEASAKSTFCAFEIGFAMALKKPIALISLDGTAPQVFAQHIQMDDLTRLQRRKPWLEQADGFLELLLQVLGRSNP